MFDGFTWGATYAINSNRKAFEQEARRLRLRIEKNDERGEVERLLQQGMYKTMNALIEEIREIDEGRLAPDLARLTSKTTGEFRFHRFREEASGACFRMSKGEFELEYNCRTDPQGSLPTTMHGSSLLTKRVKARRKPDSTLPYWIVPPK